MSLSPALSTSPRHPLPLVLCPCSVPLHHAHSTHRPSLTPFTSLVTSPRHPVILDFCLCSRRSPIPPSSPALETLPLGIHSLWTSGDWRRLLASDDLATSPLMSAPSLTAADAQLPGSGARRGMLDAVLSLSAPGEVLQDAELYLPAVPQDQEMERQYAFEFYSAQRVQMCTLPRELLDRVCSCWPGCEAGESMWEVLEPLRRVRPVNGGPGWDEEAVMGLRALDVYISAGPVDEEAMGDAANNAAA